MGDKFQGHSSLRPKQGVIIRLANQEGVQWVRLCGLHCRVQGEGIRVSDYSVQEGTETLSDRPLLHLPLSVGSSQAGGASSSEQSDLEWARLPLECCGNPCLSWVGQEGIGLPSGLSTEGLPHRDRQPRADCGAPAGLREGSGREAEQGQQAPGDPLERGGPGTGLAGQAAAGVQGGVVETGAAREAGAEAKRLARTETQ